MACGGFSCTLDEKSLHGSGGNDMWIDFSEEAHFAGFPPSRGTIICEVVGYGVEKSGPKGSEGDDTRRKSLAKLHNLNSQPPDTYIILSSNNGEAHRGGQCFGDSGGPTFDGTTSNLVVAVTSFGVGQNPSCRGIGGAYRLDQPDDLSFLARFGISP